MDTLTHIVLGACIGEVVAGKQLGKKALLIGALANNLPDCDFVVSFWLPTVQDLCAHRGFTHSFLFVGLITPLLAWLSVRVFRGVPMSFRRWLFFWGIQLFVHLFIDAFNAYGTGWFVPFSGYRVTFNTLFVADPLFSIWPAASVIILLLLRASFPRRRRWAWLGLGISAIYLLLAVVTKLSINTSVRQDLRNHHINYQDYFTTPTPLNAMLWYIVARSGEGYYVGYRSIFDHSPASFRFVPRNDSLLTPYLHTTDLAMLQSFSRYYYCATLSHDTLLFNDLCFGEILGWSQPAPPFSCYYYLQYPAANKMIIQRGRFAGWNKQTCASFLHRIAGN